MTRQLLSATDIAKLGIPGLPKTKKGIIERALKEGWEFEEGFGIGGKRKIYALPQRYWAELEQGTQLDQNSRPIAAKAIVGINQRGHLISHGQNLDKPMQAPMAADMALMRTAIEIVEHTLAEQGLAALPEVKSRLSTLIYQLAQAKGWQGALTEAQQAELKQAIA